MSTETRPRPDARTQQRRAVVGAAAIIYGLLVAFGHSLAGSEAFWNRFTMIGAFIVGILWLALMVIPWIMQRTRAA